MVDTLEKRVKEPVSFKKGSAVVDWESISKIPIGKELSGNRGIYEGVRFYLIELDVLSTTSKGNYQLEINGFGENPAIYGRTVYFTRREDAVAYRKAQFPNKKSWSIAKME